MSTVHKLSTAYRASLDAGTAPEQRNLRKHDADTCNIASGGKCGCVPCNGCGAVYHYTGDIGRCWSCLAWACDECIEARDEYGGESVCRDCAE